MTQITTEGLVKITNSDKVFSVEELAYQLFNYLPDRAKYLDKFESSQLEYERRVQSSRLVNYYKETINFYCGVISELDLTSAPFISTITDINGLGDDLTAFLNEVDKLSMVYGGVWIDVSNAEKLTLVTPRAIQTNNNGVVSYLTYDNKKIIIKEEDLVNYWYDRGTPEPGKMKFAPLWQDVVTANMALFVAESNYDALVKLYGNPVLVRVDNNGLNLNAGSVRTSINFREKNRVVDLNVGGELYFLGLSEVNAAVLRERISSLTEWLETQKQSLIPTSEGVMQRSATEVLSSENANRMQTNVLVTRKNNNIEVVLRNWLIRHYPQFVEEANKVKLVRRIVGEPSTTPQASPQITNTTNLVEESGESNA